MSKRKTQVSRMLRNNATPAERRLWHYLRNRQLDGHRFRRQHPIGTFVVDFVCLKKKVVIELDGSQHGLTDSKDAERDEWLQSRGYRVLRFWNHEVMENAIGVVETIRSELESPSPNPSLRGRGIGSQIQDDDAEPQRTASVSNHLGVE